MKCINSYIVTDEMTSVGGALLSRLLSSYDVVGGWPAEEVLPDVFLAMLAVAPEVLHETSPIVLEVRRP